MTFLNRKRGSLILFLSALSFFTFNQVKTVYGGDSGDYLSAASVWGIPHPPGYPLFSLLASLFGHFLPWNTPAWRVAFLSSIPAALTIVFLYKLLNLFFKPRISFLSSLLLAVLYPFWLYAEVVEVFSLNNFFIVLLTFLVFSFLQTKKEKYLSLFFLFLGFSFAHHHTIIFLLPAVFLVIRRHVLNKKTFKKILLILPGGLLYFYLLVAASQKPAVNWGNPNSLANLLKVFFRVGYGTFWATPGINNSILGRLISLAVFGRFLIGDFGIIGLILLLIGIFIRNKNKEGMNKKILWRYSLISFLIFTLFLGYASFWLSTDFGVATFERFMLAPYIFVTILLTFGIEKIETIFIRIFSNKKKILVTSLLFLILFINLPFRNLVKNYPKISVLKSDFTAENLAKDLLDTVEKNGAVFAISDTTFFNSVYLYYSLDYRRNEVKLINYSGLYDNYYQQWLKDKYPGIELEPLKQKEEPLKMFLNKNIDKFPIYSIPSVSVDNFLAIPFGLLYRYFPKDQPPSLESVLLENERLWQSYHSPLSGSLAKYKNLFLADTISYYEEMSKRLGEFLLINKKYLESEKYLKKSLEFKKTDSETHLLLGRLYLETNRCQEAEDKLLEVKKMIPESPFPDAYLRQVYLKCFQNEQKANQFLDSCLEKEKQTELLLPH